MLALNHADGRREDGNQLLSIEAPTSPVMPIGAGARCARSAMQRTNRDTFHETQGSGISELVDNWLCRGGHSSSKGRIARACPSPVAARAAWAGCLSQQGRPIVEESPRCRRLVLFSSSQFAALSSEKKQMGRTSVADTSPTTSRHRSRGVQAKDVAKVRADAAIQTNSATPRGIHLETPKSKRDKFE